MTTERHFHRIDAATASQLLTRNNVLILDSRDRLSFEQARIAPAAHLSSANLDELIFGTPKHAPVLIYCYHGHASQTYAQTFVDFGFQEVYSLDGGFDAWCKAQSHSTIPNLSAALTQWLAQHDYPAHDIDATAAHGITPLMRASLEGNAAIVAELIQAGARIDMKNADGNNALWLACVGENPEVFDLLIAAGIDIDHQNDNGATCLMYAASSGKAAVLKKLLTAGADTQLKTLDDFTALGMAATLDCLTLLRNSGAVE